MIPKSELAPARPVAPEARHAPAEPPPAAGAAAFERALRRLERLHDEAEEPRPDTTPAVPLAAVGTPPPLRHEAPDLAAPQPVQVLQLPQAALRHAAAAAEPVAGAPASAWRLELSATGMPPQQLQVQRTPAGTLQVVLQGAEAPAAQDRLRQRLARRGHDTRFDAPR